MMIEAAIITPGVMIWSMASRAPVASMAIWITMRRAFEAAMMLPARSLATAWSARALS